jgi:hypothetical protein
VIQTGDGRRGLVFAGVVVSLAAVGFYLTVWPGPAEPPGTEPVPAPTTAPASTAASSAGPESKPTATAAEAPFDVYSYLPLSREHLAAAADVARRFIASYGTFDYKEEPAAYADRLRGFSTTRFGEVLARSVTSPGSVQQNRDDQVVAEGTARLKGIRQVDEGSVIFVVAGTRRVTDRNGTSERTEEYAVTLIPVGDDWRVFDLQPANAGQEGDDSAGTGEAG